MKVLVSGHRYSLSNLKDDGVSILQFYQDGDIHGQTVNGPSTQEVIRACIERVESLHAEKPSIINTAIIIPALRTALAGFEARALIRKAEKGVPIEQWPVNDDGHVV